MRSNILPFRSGRKSIWFSFECSEHEFDLFSTFNSSAQIFRCRSEEMFCQVNRALNPEIIFIQSDLNWVDSFELIDLLKRKYSAPILMLYKSSKTPRSKDSIKRAYQAGVLEVIESNSDAFEIREAIEFALKVSQSALRL